MKTRSSIAAFAFSIVLGIHAQPLSSPPQASPRPADTDYSVVARHAHENVWQRTTYEPTTSGGWAPHIQQYVEIATGLNFHDADGAWQPSSAEIEPVPGGAQAVHGQHKVAFAADLATAGAISLQMPDGQELRSHLVGLRYFDQASGKSVFIAEVTNSIGEIVGANQVWYENAFAGLKATIRYTYTISSYEQDIVLQQCPLPPETYGLDSSSTVLQAVTEFLSPPAASISSHAISFRFGAPVDDETIDFPKMHIGRGRAFLIGDNDSNSVPVSKHWDNWGGHQVLIEQIPVAQIAPQLQTLSSAQVTPIKATRVASLKNFLPARPTAGKDAKPMKLANLPARQSGFVLDYVTLNSSQTNYVFQGDTTYFVTAPVTIYGALTIEGGAVVKYTTNTTGNPNLTVAASSVNCLTSPYRPAVFTARDDNSIGFTVSGSTGNPNPSGQYGFSGLTIDTTSNTYLHDLRILYVEISGIAYSSFPSGTNTVRDIQVVNAGFYGVSGGSCTVVENALLTHIGIAAIAGYNVSAVNVTADTCQYFSNCGHLYVTNSIIANATNLDFVLAGQVLDGANNGFYNTPGTFGSSPYTNSSPPFMTAVGGDYYLTNDCSFRNAGTSNVDLTVLADLQQKTTYPPIVYTNTVFWTPTSFSPQAQRDNDSTPDLGYHYDPLDYVFGGVISNANLTFTAGTAVGWYRTSSGYRGHGQPIVGIGLNMANNAIADFQGTVIAPCYWVRCNDVQEQDKSGGYGPGGITGSDDQYNENISLSAEVHMNFTKCTSMSGDQGNAFRDDWGYLIARVRNSEFLSTSFGGYVISCYITNCLLDRTSCGQVEGHPGNQWIMRNCTFHGGELYMGRVTTYASIPVSVRDCSFDSTIFSLVDALSSNPTYTDYNYDAYTNASNPFPLSSTNDVVMSGGFNWQSSWFGSYYLPIDSPLIKAGDVTADQVGLYHFTTQTNQVIEGTNTVTLGYHYVATDNNGNPLDTNGDGVPDYIEDANGNGLVDSGEIGWNINGDLGLNVLITRPKNNSVIP